MDPLRAVQPFLLSAPVTEPVTRVSERRQEQPRKKPRALRPEAESENEPAPELPRSPLAEEEDAGQHIDTEA